MSYVIDQFEAGEVKFQNGAVGWLVEGEFRPLMPDAVQDLLTEGLIDDNCAKRTKDAREAYTIKVLTAYAKNYAGPSDEEILEARAAHGEGKKMINVITGQKWTT